MKIKINPDMEYADSVRAAVKSNGGYCPCKLERTKDTKCICREFREQESGLCGCGLYIKEE